MSFCFNDEEIISMIGQEKYDKLKEYLDIVCPKENIRKYFEELDKMWDYPVSMWEQINDALVKKYGVILLNDVLCNQSEWIKFENWCCKQKYNVKKKDK